jgi:hypothetical protein
VIKKSLKGLNTFGSFVRLVELCRGSLLESGQRIAMKRIKSYDDEEGYVRRTCDVIEENTDEPLGNFTGLYNKDGKPLFRPKEKIGFKAWK